MSVSSINSKILNCLPLLGVSEKKPRREVMKSFVKLKEYTAVPEENDSIIKYNLELQQALERDQQSSTECFYIT